MESLAVQRCANSSTFNYEASGCFIQGLTGLQMDAIIVFGTIPTLWPLLRLFSGKCVIRPGKVAPYERIQNTLDYEDGAEPFQLSDRRRNRTPGPATRVLEELDSM